MRLMHYIKKEASGLFTTAMELCKYEEKQGHTICVRQPGTDQPLYGRDSGKWDMQVIHSQMPIKAYHNNVPAGMFMHGEPLSSVGNGVSMKAIVELASLCEFFICMRQEEWPIWNSIKRTFVVPKGIDLEKYRPLDTLPEKLSGEPAVLYIENWRGNRNPLYLCVAMQEVWKKHPNARLHLYNITDKRMLDTFKALIDHNKWHTFIRSLQGPVADVNELYNKVDMVVSCLHPLYARGIEAFGAGKAFIGPGYREPGYPWTCDLDPISMAETIMACWEDYDKVNYRQWAIERHDANESVRQCIEVYQRYL